MFPILNRETQCKLLENETKQLAEAAIFPPATAGPPTGNRRLEGVWQRAILFGYTQAASQDKLTTSNNTVVPIDPIGCFQCSLNGKTKLAPKTLH